tara:strand:- start:62911 stop:63126 length:216 start_codon:yes stop_codon:yes gene_type:complete
MMGFIRALLKGFVVLLILSEITGCTTFYSEKASDDQCLTAPVLYTDLTKANQDRQYTLPNGKVCTIFDETN